MKKASFKASCISLNNKKTGLVRKMYRARFSESAYRRVRTKKQGFREKILEALL